MARKPLDFDLIRWPIDIVVFVLAFGYGVTRILDVLSLPFSLETSRIFAYACLAFVSTLIVRRYLPSDSHLEKYGNVPTVLWINLSMALAVCMPAIAIYYSGHAIFWILIVGSSAAKSILALETRRPKETGKLIQTNFRSESASLIERYLLRSDPDAYALQAVPTAILFTATGCGFVLVLRFHSLAGLITGSLIIILSSVLYVNFSTKARLRALNRARKDATQQDVQPDGH